ncbi:MAG: flippase-like domain-containing protein [Bryobacteraceae bacterium]
MALELVQETGKAGGNRRTSALYLVLTTLLAGSLLYLSLRGIAWAQVGHALGSARLQFVALAIAFSTTALLLRSVRWRILLGSECPVSALTAFLAAAAGYLGNNVLPARAGEVIRTLLVTRRSGGSKAFVLTTVLCERVCDAVALLIITAGSLLLLPVQPGWLSRAVVSFSVLAGVGVVAIVVSPRLERPGRKVLEKLPIPARLQASLSGTLGNVVSGVRQFHDPSKLFLFAALTGLIWLVDGFTALACAASLGLALTLPIVLLLNSALGLGSALPSTPGYVGIYQFVTIFVLTPFGVPKSSALAFTLIAQACTYIVVIFWGTIALVYFQRAKAASRFRDSRPIMQQGECGGMGDNRGATDPVSVVMVAFNEARTIEAEVLRFHSAIVERLPDSEFIVAEDGSTDGTSAILEQLARRVGIIHLTGTERKGYKRALLDAVMLARNPWVFFSDSGGKHDPEEFWKLYPLRNEYDLIVGRKTGRKDQPYRRLLTWAYNLVLRTYFGFDSIRDADSGFRLFNRAVVDRVLGGGLIFRNLIASEVVLRTIACGLKYREVPISYDMREGVSRGLPPRRIPRVALDTLRAMVLLKSELHAQSPGG